MKLYYSITSPFARKVRIAAALLGIESQIELLSTDVYAKNDYHRVNPLVKIPALQLQDGTTLTNSPFILEYLNSISLQKKILPVAGPERWTALNFQSIADGIMEAAVLRRYEILRPIDRRDPAFDRRQKEKIEHALEYFEARYSLLKQDWGVSEISLACALGYLELRYAKEDWLKNFPRLSAWYKQIRELPVMKKTEAQI